MYLNIVISEWFYLYMKIKTNYPVFIGSECFCSILYKYVYF